MSIKKPITVNATNLKKKVIEPENKAVIYTLFGILCIILGLPAYFRGMFFEPEQFILYIFTAVLFIIYCGVRIIGKHKLSFNNLLDISLLGLFVSYVISSFYAPINVRFAFSEVMKYFDLLLTFLLVRGLVDTDFKINILLNTIMAAITGTAYIGIGAAAGIFPYSGAYSAAANENWINGTLQYHNAFGSFCVCGIVLCYFLYAKSNNFLQRAAYSLCGFTMLIALIFTESRGALVIMALVVALIFILSLTNKFFGNFTSFSLIIAIPFIVVVKAMGTAILERSWQGVWGYYILGLAIAVLITLLIRLITFVCAKYELNIKALSLISAGVLLVVLISAVAINPQIIAKVLPQKLIDRVSTINVQADTFQERLVFYKDSFKLVQKSPVFGSGGNAWKATFNMYQSYSYLGNLSHSYIMQVWAETGTLGLIFLLCAIGSFFFMAIRNLIRLKGQNEKFMLQAAVAVAGAGLILHSVFDFDMSLMCVSLTLWAFYAIISGQYDKSIKFGFKVPTALFIILTILLLLFASLFKAAYDSNLAGQYSANASDYKSSLAQIKTAISLDSLNAEYPASFIKALLFMSQNKQQVSQEDVNFAKEKIEAMQKVDSYGITTTNIATQLYFALQDVPNGLKYAEKQLNLQPLLDSNYIQISSIYMQLYDSYVKENKQDDAKSMIVKCEQSYEKLSSLYLSQYEVLKKYHRTEDAKSMLDKCVNLQDTVKETITGKPVVLTSVTLQNIQKAKEIQMKIKE